MFGSVALLSHNTLKWSAILGLRFFARCWWPRESMLRGSSALSEFRTSLSKALKLWHCVKVKQRCLCYVLWIFFFTLRLPKIGFTPFCPETFTYPKLHLFILDHCVLIWYLNHLTKLMNLFPSYILCRTGTYRYVPAIQISMYLST